MAAKWGSVRVETLPEAVVILETPSSPLDARLKALRFIQTYVEAERLSSMVDRMKVNQLVLDSIMSLLNRDDLIPDLRKRQLIRTECFIMLAKMLESKSLFAGAKSMDDSQVSYAEDKDVSKSGKVVTLHESRDDAALHMTTADRPHDEGKNSTTTLHENSDDTSVFSRSVSVTSLPSHTTSTSSSTTPQPPRPI